MNNDLISRKWLTDAIRNRRTYLSYEDAKDVIDLIDNAPSVEPEKVLIANVTFDEDKLKEIVQTKVIDKIKSGELVLKEERPQGEWLKNANEIYKCSLCGAYGNPNYFRFCPNCGAKMKGGADNEHL